MPPKAANPQGETGGGGPKKRPSGLRLPGKKRETTGAEKTATARIAGAGSPPRHAWPRSCRACGNRSYLDPLPVVVVLLPAANGLVVIRRNTEPQKEPSPSQGGDLDVGESWQERGKRELLEETGIDISGSELAPYGVMNGLDGTLIAFGLAARHPSSSLRPFASEETEEVALIDRPIELGFSMHTRLVARYFAGQGGQRPLQRR